MPARPAAIVLTVAFLVAHTASAQSVDLPSPATEGSVPVEEAIFRRTSVRQFANTPLTPAQIGQLLWAAVGITVDGVSGPTRAAPSAGGLHPVRAYVVVGNAQEIEPGVYRYDPVEHQLERIEEGDLREPLSARALGQAAVRRAPCVVVLAADYAVTRRRYGSRGVERYVHLDAGHAAQNVALQAEALGLALVTIGAFGDDGVQRLLGIETEPLYLLPVGRPR
jgi:SagB-type dehydrogenase family enzyme